MQAFTMLWMFDNRWLFKIRNPLLQFLLIIPILLNVATIALMIIQKQSNKMEMDSYFILLVTFYSISAIIPIYLIMIVYFTSQKRLHNLKENVEKIRAFTHNFQIKKVLWSFLCFFFALLTLAQVFINNHYISLNEKMYPMQTLITRFYIDIGLWGYIALTILIFLLFKLGYLLLAWKLPQKYLRIKSII